MVRVEKKYWSRGGISLKNFSKVIWTLAYSV